MNPFDAPPSGDPVSLDGPPAPAPGPARSRRGRTALVAALTLGLVGAGVAGVSQLASADRPDLAASAQDEPDDTVSPADDESTGEMTGDESPAGEPDDGSPDSPEEPGVDGEIVLDVGDGDPVVIDLGDLDADRIEALTECVGLPLFDHDAPFGDVPSGDWTPGEFPLDLDRLFDDLPIGDMGGLGGFDSDGGSVTVVGPDGVSVVDLGDNGSVTVTSDNGEVTIATDGDATVSDLDDLFGDFGRIFDGGFFDDEMFSDEASGAWPTIEAIDPDAIQSCIDELLGN